MKELHIDTSEIKSRAALLSAGDRIFLSGVAYTARDAAHKKIVQMLQTGEKLPFDLDGACVYYAGPTPTPPGLAIGSCGPTTSSRMDVYTPKLLDRGLAAMVGKGGRNEEVCRAIERNGAVYLCAIGGAGALASRCISKCEVIAFEELGCESVKKIEFKEFPLIVGIDCHGGNLFVH